jgi:hypothetical protein
MQRTSAERASPWAEASARPVSERTQSTLALARDILGGREAITAADRRSGRPDASDQAQLFSAFRGLESLRSLAVRAQDATISADERARIQARFATGVDQVQGFLAGLNLQRVIAVPGSTPDRLEASVDLRRPATSLTTIPLHTGDRDQVVERFAGDVRFALTVNQGQPGEVAVNIDLGDMGATPRSIAAVTTHINEQLETAGVSARFQIAELGRAPPPAGSTAPGPMQFGWRVSTSSSQTISFSAPTAEPSITVISSVGARGEIAKLRETGLSAPTERVALSDIAGDPVSGQSAAVRVRSAVSGLDGTFYVVGQTEGAIDRGLGLKANTDAFLTKYDSAGRRIWTRPLGATQEGQGFSVAVGADGRVAVAGAARGRVEGVEATRGETDAFVTVFDEDGAEQWTRTFGSSAMDDARAVAIGADGAVFLGGRTRGDAAGPGAALGGQDGFVVAFSATGDQRFAVQLGGSAVDSVDALAIAQDGGLLVGGMQNGSGQLRKLDATTGVETWSLSTGWLGPEGAFGSIAVEGASIAIAGRARTDDLGLGVTPITANAGAADGFVAVLQDGVIPAVSWATFTGGARSDSASAITISGGAVFVTGSEQSGESDPARAFVEKIDLSTGARLWKQTQAGEARASDGVAVLVDPTGASVLDRLGLPKGDVVFGDTAPLVERTTLRAGDHFFVRSNDGPARRITISREDTLATIARSVNTALFGRGVAEARFSNDGDRIRVTANEGQKISFEPGAAGQDALRALGLRSGPIVNAYDSPREAVRQGQPVVVALGFDPNMRIGDAVSAASVLRSIETSQAAVRDAFGRLFQDESARLAASRPSRTGPTPPALQAQLANYRAGLERLQGGSQGSVF